MTREKAARYHKAFGPCSVVYETMTVDELLDDANAPAFPALGSEAAAPPLSEAEWLEVRLSVEEIVMERDAEALSHSYPLAGSDGFRKAMAGIRERTLAVLASS